MLVETRKEITKEEFEYLQTCDVDEFHDYIANLTLKSPFPCCGYGFYAPKIMRLEDKFYASWQRYDSCD